MKRTRDDVEGGRKDGSNGQSNLPSHLLNRPRVGLSKNFLAPKKKENDSNTNNMVGDEPKVEVLERNYFQASPKAEEICLCVEFLVKGASSIPPASSPSFGTILFNIINNSSNAATIALSSRRRRSSTNPFRSARPSPRRVLTLEIGLLVLKFDEVSVFSMEGKIVAKATDLVREEHRSGSSKKGAFSLRRRLLVSNLVV